MSRSFARRLLSLPAIRNRAARLTLEHLESRDVPTSLFNTLTPVTVSPGLLGDNNFGCVATGDFTDDGKDGKTDLVMTNYGAGGPGTNSGGNTLTILEPTAAGKFSVSSTLTVSSDQYVSFVAVGDLTGNGIDDLAVVSSSENSDGNLTIFMGNGNGTFTKGSTYATGLNNVDWVGIAPMFAGSTVPSIVVSAFGHTAPGGTSGSSGSGSGTTIGGNGVELYQGLGNGTFSLATTYQQGLAFIPTACVLGYFSGSSNLDIACAVPGAPPESTDPQPDGTVEILVNNGEGGLTEGSVTDSGGPLPTGIATTEFTSSGLPDLVVANAGDPTATDFTNSSIGVLINGGGGTFSESTIHNGIGTNNSYGVFAVATGDFNLDGNQDIAAVEYGNSSNSGKAALLEYAGNGQGTNFTLDANAPYESTTTDGQYLAVGNFDNTSGDAPDVVICTADSSYDVFMNTTVGSTPTTTTVTSTPSSPITQGTSITFTATISNSPSVGTVTFYAGPGLTNPIGSAVPVTNGTAMSTADTTLPSGTDTITAVYTGGTGFTGSQGTESVVVNASTTTTVSSTPASPIAQGTSIVFTATISGSPSVGTVTFYAGPGLTNPIGVPDSVTNGTAVSAADTTLPLGANTITAVYSGGTGFQTSQGTESVTVNAGTTTTVTSTPSSPITLGTSIDFTATISGSPGVGTVTFYAGPGLTNPIGSPVSVSGGTATSTADTTLPAGSDTITAVYSGGSGFESSQGTETVVVNTTTTTSVSSTPASPITQGTSIDFTATISNNPSVGTVTFYAGPGTTNPIGSPVSVSGGTATSAADTTLPVGNDTITAVYSGGTGFLASQGSESVTVNAATTTTVTSTPLSPINQGTSIDFTATISGSPSVGTVTFYAGPGLTNPIGSPVTVSGGTATSSPDTTLPVGSNTITAVYGGGPGFGSSQGTETVVVNSNTTTTVSSSPSSPIIQGTAIDFTATISGSPSVGTVTFYIGVGLTNPIGSPVPVSGGTATSSATTSLPLGSDTIMAVYTGGTGFAGSQGTETVVVNSSTTTTVSSTPSSPIILGTSIDFTATISGSPSVGTVTFYAGPGLTNPIGSPDIVFEGTATSSATSSLPLGSDIITAVYSGGTDFASSQGTETVVVNSSTTTTVSSTPSSPIAAGTPIEFTATISGSPSVGTVTFYAGPGLTNPIGSPATVSGGIATSAATTLPTGSDTITAVYSGGTGFAGSEGTETVVVNANTTTSVSSTPSSPITQGTSIDFTATISGSPSVGTVTFYAGPGTTNPIGSPVTVSGGTATSAADTTLPIGSDTITAVYSGGTGFSGSQGTEAVTVNDQPPTVATAAAANPSTVTGTTTALSVLGADAYYAESTLTYTWATIGSPPASVSFSANGTNAAQDTTATFTAAGSYDFQATITAPDGYTATSDVAVTVNQTLTSIVVNPSSITLPFGGTQTFSATAKDQFGTPLSSQPAFNWTSNVGSINASGNFTAQDFSSTGTVTATSGSISGTSAVTVFGQHPIITSSNSTTFTAGVSGSSFTVTASGYPAPTFTEAGPLPSGVSFTAGVLSGTPAVGTEGVYPIVFIATNGVSPDAIQAFTLTVDQAPAFTSSNNTTFKVGTAGTFSVTASGYPASSFTEVGTLPTGVTLTLAGVLSGTPAAGTEGSYSFIILANNGVSPDATQPFTLTVDQAPAITSSNSTTFKVGAAGSSFSVTASGYPAPTFTEVDPLPSGVTLTSAGVLSGTPAAGTGGDYPIVIVATNGASPDATQAFNLIVDQAPAFTSASSTGFTIGASESFTVTASGYPAPTFTESGLLPTGVTLSSAGVLSGTPAAGTAGNYSILITATNDVSPDTTQPFTLTIGQAASLANSFVTVSSGSVQAGLTSTITLQAVDAFGNDLTVGGLSVAFALGSGIGQGTITAATDKGNGTYTATFTGTTAGSNTITATIGGKSVTSPAPTITVTPGQLSLTHTQVVTLLASVQLGGQTTIVLQGEDAYGNLETEGGATNIGFVLENSSIGRGSIGPVTDNNNGTYTATFIGTVDGSTTIEATIGGTPIASTGSIGVTGAAVNKADSIIAVSSPTVQSGNKVTVTLQAESGKGVKEISGGLIVGFSLGSGNGGLGTFGPVSYNSALNVYQAQFTGTIAGSNTIIATVNGSKVTSKAPKITVTVGTFSYSNSIVTVSAVSVQAGKKITVTFQPRDAAGNNLKLPGLTIGFKLDGSSTAQGTFSNPTYKNGVYTSTFTGTTVGGSTILTTVNTVPVTYTPPVITVTPGTALAANSPLTVTGGTTTMASGSTLTLTIQAVDLDHNLESAGGLRVAFMLASTKKGAGLGKFTKVTDNKNGTYTVTFTAGTSIGTNIIEATINGVKLTSTVAITVTP